MSLAVFTLGGTISMTGTSHGAAGPVVGRLTGRDLMSAVPGLDELDEQLDVHDVQVTPARASPSACCSTSSVPGHRPRPRMNELMKTFTSRVCRVAPTAVRPLRLPLGVRRTSEQADDCASSDRDRGPRAALESRLHRGVTVSPGRPASGVDTRHSLPAAQDTDSPRDQVREARVFADAYAARVSRLVGKYLGRVFCAPAARARGRVPGEPRERGTSRTPCSTLR